MAFVVWEIREDEKGRNERRKYANVREKKNEIVGQNHGQVKG